MTPVINVSLGAFPGRNVMRAMELAREASEPLWGALSLNRVQICPQNLGQVTDEVVAEIKSAYPQTRFRLHANARVLSKHLPLAALSSWRQNREYFEELARISRLLGADGYTLHSGYRRDCDLDQLFDYAREAEEMFGIPVGIEGMYPDRLDQYLVSTWDEYLVLHESGCRFALDLSHLNILFARTGIVQHNLVCEMLASDRCMEIHVSGNNGDMDSHQILSQPPWWKPYLTFANPRAVVFSEGNQVRH